LPDSSTAVRAEFADFESARSQFENIEPYKTTVDDLKTLGFDTASPNVRLIGYPDIVGRLATEFVARPGPARSGYSRLHPGAPEVPCL
jgi:hypothetical protein